MGAGSFNYLIGLPRLRFSPVGEWLSFAWPKESHQRKGHPCCAGLRLPCAARRPGRRGNSPWRAAQNAAHCGARTSRAFLPRSTALLGDPEGASMRAPVLGYRAALRDGGSRACSPSALPIWCGRTGKERNPVRGPQQGTSCVPCQGELVERPSARAKSGTRRAAMRGRLFFGHFLLAKQKKVPRQQARSEAVVLHRYSSKRPE